jgi:hypothetical protein
MGFVKDKDFVVEQENLVEHSSPARWKWAGKLSCMYDT